MDPTTWQTLQRLFHAALERPASARAAFLDDACAGDAALRAELEGMLAGHEDSGALRIEGALLADAGAAGADDAALAGARIGPWRLVRVIGRGGMGDVWLAERADGAYQQRAALKRVRAGWRPAALLERFRRERQTLARLAHPNIARLLDGGASESGEPYLAMEFVEGRSIVEWCDERRLGVRERLRLFLRVCDAVSHAHAHLVVHRDLKPANILVTADGRPVLLDFGIAKLLDPDEADTARTRADERLLTPEHAAPEQLAGEPITTATDVWALGALLHELLTGTRAYGAPGEPAARLARRVLEEEPRRPSECALDRDAARAEGAAERAARRGCDPATLARALRGDLDAIVTVALRRDPARRFASVERLAEDVERHLDGQPVHARPGTTRYRLGRFVARHRAAAAAAAVAVVSLLAFGGVAAWQARRAALERDRAHVQQARAERALSVLVDLFRVSDPRAHPGGDTLRVADLLRLAEGRIDSIEDDPLIRARLWEAMASIHGARSELAEQRDALTRARAGAQQAGDADLALRAEGGLGELAARLEGAAVAESLLRLSLAAHQRRYAPDDARMAEALQRLGYVARDPAERRSLLERALAIRRRRAPDGSVEVAASLNALANQSLSEGDLAGARRRFEESMALTERLLPEGHPDRLLLRHNVAEIEAASGAFTTSARMASELLPLRRRYLGARTTAVAASLLLLGTDLAALGRHTEAADTLALAADILTGVFGPGGHAVTGVERHLALAELRAGRVREGQARLSRLLAAGARAPGGPSAETAFLALRAALLEGERTGRPDLDAARGHLATVLRKRGRAHAIVAEALVATGAMALADPARARPGEADSLFRAAIARVDSFVPPAHPLADCARCGALLARARAGERVDPGALAAARRACGRWGLAPRVLAAPAEATAGR